MADQRTHENRAERWLMRREETRGLRPRDAAYLIVGLWFVAVVAFGVVEHLADKATFPTVWLGMWWALQTVTTVGYGDVVPATTLGRTIASFLLLGGLALISVVTATITSGFVARSQRQTLSAGDDATLRALDEIAGRLDAIEDEVARLQPGRGGGAGPS